MEREGLRTRFCRGGGTAELLLSQRATKPDLAEQVVPKSYFGQLGAGSPGDFLGRKQSWLMSGCCSGCLSRVDRLILASCIYPEEELQQCQPAAPGSRSLFIHSPWNSCWELRGSRGTAQGSSWSCCAFLVLLTLGSLGTVWDPWAGMSNSPWERLFLMFFWDQPTALTIPH